MTEFLFPTAGLAAAIAALKADLLAEGGPSISTMRNYRFAILVYQPDEEFRLRLQVRRLSDDLRAAGRGVLSLDLQQLLLARLRAQSPDALARLVARERALYAKAPERALELLKEKLGAELEGPNGIARDVVQRIAEFSAKNPEAQDRSVVFVGRAGALYPFFRSSALLKHIDGHTGNVPVVLLYPGERRGPTGLSFMCKLHTPDRDYRPRIYS